MNDQRTATTLGRIDPATSFERHCAAMRASWSPEVQAYAASLVEEIEFARHLREFRDAFGLSQRPTPAMTEPPAGQPASSKPVKDGPRA